MKKLFRVFSIGIAATLLAAFIGFARPASADTATVPVLLSVTSTTTVYDAPFTTADSEGALYAGQTWFVLGTDTTAKWVLVSITQAGLNGWAPASAFNLGGLSLPVVTDVAGGPTSGAIAVAAPAASAATPVATTTVPLLLTVANTNTDYDAPSTTANSEGSLVAGQTWFVLGIDSTHKWVLVSITQAGLNAWVPAATFDLTGLNLPVVS